MHRLLAAAFTILLLAGCTAAPATGHSPVPTSAAISASAIVTMHDAEAWAKKLNPGMTGLSDEMSTGISKIGDIVPAEGIWFETNNKIGQELITLNNDVLDDPDGAAVKIDDLKALITEIQVAVDHGDKP